MCKVKDFRQDEKDSTPGLFDGLKSFLFGAAQDGSGGAKQQEHKLEATRLDEEKRKADEAEKEKAKIKAEKKAEKAEAEAKEKRIAA